MIPKSCYLLAIAFIIGAQSAKLQEPPPNCDELKGEAEQCISSIFFKYFGNDPPQTEEEVLSNCADSETLLRCARRYKPCVRMLPGTVYSIALKSSKKMLKRFCDPNDPTERLRMLEHMTCFTNDKKELLMDEMKRAVALLKYASTLEAKTLIPAGCCGALFVQQEGERIVFEQCGNGTAQKILDYIQELTLPYAAEQDTYTSLICGKLLTMEACEKYQPDLMDDIRRVATPPIDIDLEKEPLITPMIDLALRLSRQFENREENE